MVKVTPCHACAGTEGRHRYSSNPFAIDARMGWSTPCPSCFAPDKTWYHPYRRLGGPWGLVWSGMENPLHWDLILDHTTRTHTHTNTYPAVKLNRMEYLLEVRVEVHVAK